jgi:ubiquinone/menaquinone biosynthesis C-methylase UbiE
MEFCVGPEWRQLVVETILPTALAGVELGDHAIEIGPGPGFTTDVLMTMTGQLTAVEIDDGLADALEARMAGSNVHVVRGDATSLNLPDSSFTGGASFHMLHHIPTEAAQDLAFSELARVLRAGSMFVAADGVYNEATAAFHHDDIYNPIAPDALAPRLATAGFTDVEVREYDLGWVCTARAT